MLLCLRFDCALAAASLRAVDDSLTISLEARALDVSSMAGDVLKESFKSEILFFVDADQSGSEQGMEIAARNIFLLFYSDAIIDSRLSLSERKNLINWMIRGDDGGAEGLEHLMSTTSITGLAILLDTADQVFQEKYRSFDADTFLGTAIGSLIVSALGVAIFDFLKFWKKRRARMESNPAVVAQPRPSSCPVFVAALGTWGASQLSWLKRLLPRVEKWGAFYRGTGKFVGLAASLSTSFFLYLLRFSLWTVGVATPTSLLSYFFVFADREPLRVAGSSILELKEPFEDAYRNLDLDFERFHEQWLRSVLDPDAESAFEF